VLLKTSVWVTPYAIFEKGGQRALPFSLSASLLTLSLLQYDKIEKLWYNMPDFALGRGRPVRWAFGPLIKLEVRSTRPLTWLGPAWAALCGAVASGWLTFNGQNLLVLLIALFLADALWGTLWHLITETEWFVSSNWLSQAQEASLTALPYTAPGSPSHRIFGRLGRMRAWWRGVFWPRRGSALLGLIVVLPLTLILAIILGRRVIILTLAALAIMVLALLRARRQSAPPPSLRAVLEMGLAWLAGHTAFGPLSLWSFLLAALYTVTYHSCLKLARNGAKRWLILLTILQAAVIALLIFFRQPVMAGVVGLLLLPQMLLQPFLDQGKVELWYLRRTGPLLMAGMLLAALAIR
jgi:chlorophyll synthase